MQPLRSFQAQWTEEVEWAERVRRREFPAITRLTQIGRLLIALRIAQGLTQRELAQRLGVSVSLVSRDERNEYHGVTVERAQRILDALNETLTAHVEEPARRPGERQLVVPA
jgi:ribosome-binding protein aMBF1 (putative translation factor)